MNTKCGVDAKQVDLKLEVCVDRLIKYILKFRIV